MLSAKLSDRLRLLRLALPLGIALVTAFYQLGLARYVHNQLDHELHWAMEILLYSLVGPLVIWFSLRVIHQWIIEKEQAEAQVYRLNNELQQRVAERTRELHEKNDALAAANRRLQELDQLKSEFVSMVSHELRAPLTNMRGALELMEGSCRAPNPTCTRMFATVNTQVHRLGRMVEEVLNVSRIEAGGLALSLGAVDVVWLTDRAIDEFAVRHTLRQFRRPTGTDRLRLWADSDRLYEVIANLIDNAIKYSPEGSPVTVSTQVRDNEGIVSVNDGGRGIPPEEHSQIFDRFYRHDTGDSKETYGTGLGLYFCRRVIEAMGGRIWVESEPGHGATFRFALPLADG